MPLGRIEHVSMPSTAVLAQHELLGRHLGLGVEVVETFCVGQGFVAAGDHLAAHHHAVGRGVDEALHARRPGGVHQVLGAADVDGEAALPVLVGDGPAAHQVDDRRGVEDGVDARDGRGDVVGVGDVADDGLQPRMVGQRGRCAVERADLVSAVE